MSLETVVPRAGARAGPGGVFDAAQGAAAVVLGLVAARPGLVDLTTPGLELVALVNPLPSVAAVTWAVLALVPGRVAPETGLSRGHARLGTLL